MSEQHAVIQVEVEELGPVKRKLTINIASEQVSEAFEQAYTKLQQEAKLKGFRKGKVPRNLLVQHYGAAAQEEAVEWLVKNSYPEAVTKSGVTPLARPAIEPGPLTENAPFQYVATIEVRPTITVRDYSGVSLEREEFVIEESSIEEQLTALRHNMMKLLPVEGDVELSTGMVARVDFTGTSDGKPFEGSEAKDFLIDVGSGSVLPDFEQQILGMKLGETREVKFQYPAEYFNISLAGGQATFHVTLKDVKSKSLPDLTDEFAKELGEYQTMQEVRAAVRKQLEERNEQTVRSNLGQQAIEQLLAQNPFEIPESMVGWELQYMFHQLHEQLQGEGRTIEQAGITPEAFVAEHEPLARQRVQQRLLLDAIAEAEQLQVSDEDVENRLKQIAESVGETLPKVRLHYEQKNLLPGLKIALLQEKALDFVIERAKIKLKKAKKEKKG